MIRTVLRSRALDLCKLIGVDFIFYQSGRRLVVGNAPDGYFWTGTAIAIPRPGSATDILHELAHYIVAKKSAPQALGQPNFGLDSVHFREAERMEMDTCDVTLALYEEIGAAERKVIELAHFYNYEDFSLEGESFDSHIEAMIVKAWDTIQEVTDRLRRGKTAAKL